MGSVYQVVRADEVYHRVCALKVMQPGLAGTALRERFRNERQILARLDHPNIARIVDGGTTNSGLPYFVMDYVDGAPISEFCRNHKLSPGQRLTIFRQVCAAIQYLHESFVVHGDLKPPNILVGGDGAVKLLDFGIASVLRPGASSQALHQAALPPLMTAGYASPEQLRNEDIGPLSDVYSLGIVLYELLVGVRPYPSDGMTAKEVLQAIESTPIRPPSQAFGDRAGYPGGGAEVRRALGEELDAIVLKAMHKDQEERYQSAAAIGKDLENYQLGLPVAAWLRGSPVRGAVYRAKKFLARNRVQTLVAAAMLALIALNLWQREERLRLSRVNERAVTVKQTKAVRDEEKFTKQLSQAKAMHPNGIPQAELVSLRKAQLLDVNELSEAYRVPFSESVRLWPGMTPERRNLLDQAGIYLQQAEAIVAEDQAAREELAVAWLWIAKIQGDPRVPNLEDKNGAATSINEARRVLFEDDSPRARQLLNAIGKTEEAIGPDSR
jgi:hypothetical protein